MCVISHCFIDPRWILETMQESMSALLRSSGLALPPASLPGRFGMGEIGTEAHHWIGCLSCMGQSFWQMPLPAPRIVEEAPGSALSSYAGNPMLLSFDALRYDGVLLPGVLTNGTSTAAGGAATLFAVEFDSGSGGMSGTSAVRATGDESSSSCA